MSVQTFSFPTATMFGAGALAELPGRLEKLGVRRPLVVTDSGLVNTPAFRALAQTLGEASQGKSWFLYSGVHPNPVENDVRESGAAFRGNKCDAVIAIGGGGALDGGQSAPAVGGPGGVGFATAFLQAAGGGGARALFFSP